MARCSRRRLALGGLSSIWAFAMLVLGLRLVMRAAITPAGAPLALFGIALTMAALGLFAQQVANRIFPARSRRVSDTLEIATGSVFIASLTSAALWHVLSS